MVWEQRRNRAKRSERNAQAVARGEAVERDEGRDGWFGADGLIMGLIIVAGSLLLGGATALCWCFTANALLDNAQAQDRPAQIEQMVSVTHSFLFREYKIEY